MKLHVYLSGSGMEHLAKGGLGNLSSWNFVIRCQHEGQEPPEPPDSRHVKVGEFEPTLPGRDNALGNALGYIEDEVRRVRAQCEMDLKELAQRKNDLLMITWDPKEN
jgi:hypothetical protein